MFTQSKGNWCPCHFFHPPTKVYGQKYSLTQKGIGVHVVFFIHQQKCPATNVHTIKGELVSMSFFSSTNKSVWPKIFTHSKGNRCPCRLFHPPTKMSGHKCSHTQRVLKPRAGNGAIFKEEMLHTLRVLGDIPAESGKVASHHLDWWLVGQTFRSMSPAMA